MELLNLIAEKGASLGQLAMVVIFFMLIFKDAIKNCISKIGPKGSKVRYSMGDLKNHDVFSELETFKSFRKTFMHGDEVDKTKTKVFNDFLMLKLEGTSDTMLLILKEVNCKMTRAEVKRVVHHRFTRCNERLEVNIRETFSAKGVSDEQAALLVGKFFTIRQNAMARYAKRIDSVFACDFYETNFQLVLAIFEIVAFEIDDIIENIVRTFESVNGLFAEIDYK
jgi:hypothetical protein